jgi:hypothetical protein
MPYDNIFPLDTLSGLKGLAAVLSVLILKSFFFFFVDNKELLSRVL